MLLSEPTVAQDQLLVLVHDSKATKYAIVASTALLYYDSLLTFSQEVDLVWRRRLGWGNILYWCISIIPLATICLFDVPFRIVSSSVTLWIVEFSLAIRVWVLYNRSLTLLLSLGAIYACCIAVITVLHVQGLLHSQILSLTGPFLSGCSVPIPTWYYSINIPPLFTTFLLMILTLYRTLRTVRCMGSTEGMPLVAILLRDGLLNFSAVATILIVNILLVHVARATLVPLGTGFLVAVPCISGTRLFLNVRQKLFRPNLIIAIPLETLETRRPAPLTVVTDMDEMPSGTK
ncbi:hypothetical protein JB92DRAFT_1837837 [Gautieria morchelliformis]|nr:hypothetical protein JB92DRAFT_1837837 [Gautieria morchelliformis]